LRNPFLFKQIKQINDVKSEAVHLLPGFFEACVAYLNDDFATARTKQWLNQLRVTDERIQSIFDEVKVLKKPTEFIQKLNQLLI
jgi:tRNA-dihydrouridine synthase C